MVFFFSLISRFSNKKNHLTFSYFPLLSLLSYFLPSLFNVLSTNILIYNHLFGAHFSFLLSFIFLFVLSSPRPCIPLGVHASAVPLVNLSWPSFLQSFFRTSFILFIPLSFLLASLQYSSVSCDLDKPSLTLATSSPGAPYTVGAELAFPWAHHPSLTSLPPFFHHLSSPSSFTFPLIVSGVVPSPASPSFSDRPHLIISPSRHISSWWIFMRLFVRCVEGGAPLSPLVLCSSVFVFSRALLKVGRKQRE